MASWSCLPDERTLTGQKGASLDAHLAACVVCRAIAAERSSSKGTTAGQAALPAAGERIGRFVVVEARGAGAMGAVVAAYDPDLDRKIAIKLPRADVVALATTRERLIREARAMAKLSHDRIIGLGQRVLPLLLAELRDRPAQWTWALRALPVTIRCSQRA